MEDAWPLLTVLTEPLRRSLYVYVRTRHRPVTRDEAARACGVSRGLAAFHLEKLVEAGLLHADYVPSRDAESGRRSRGRPPKAYRPADTEVRISLPERRYDLLGGILLDALARRPADAREAALSAAIRHGREIGEASAGRTVLEVLADLGYEPLPLDETRLALANCPFHRLAQRERQLVCGMNRAFCEGLFEGLGVAAATVPVSRPDRCCVEVRLPGHTETSGHASA
ncbi:MAG: helix-turn-helix transcriptional regulator [Streptosporangiaceae bacterium]